MSVKGVKWRGATLDPSGYGSANRDYVFALHKAGIEVTVEPWNFEARPAAFYGAMGEFIESRKNRNIDFDFVVHHYVPNKIRITEEEKKNKINIGISTWEADLIPEHWVNNINTNFDLQIVPSEYNKEAYIKSGITIPVKVIPHCIDVAPFDKAESAYFSKYEDHFKFLSVFQWTERKNPIGLIKTYLSAFYGCSDVVLFLKTYGINYTEQEKDKVREMIKRIKKDTQLNPDKLPPIYLIPELITREEMISLYKMTDCFVLASRSEGFGIPYAEACAGENTIIATNHGGQVDFLKGFDFAQLIQYQFAPVCHMPFPYYTSLMTWAEPDLIQLKGAMQEYYALAKQKNSTMLSILKQSARREIEKMLSYDIIGNKFKKILLNEKDKAR